MAGSKGSPEVKTILPAELNLTDGGSIDSVIRKLGTLNKHMQDLGQAFDTAMAKGGRGKTPVEQTLLHLTDATKHLADLQKKMLELGRQSGLNGKQATLIGGAGTIGEMRALQELAKVHDAIFQKKVLSGQVSAKQIVDELDSDRQRLAIQTLRLKANSDINNGERMMARERLAEIKMIRAEKKQAIKDEQELMRQLRAEQTAADRKHAREVEQSKLRTQGLLSSEAIQNTKQRASVRADAVTYVNPNEAINRAVTGARRKVERFDLTEGLRSQALAAKGVDASALTLEQALNHARLSNIRLALAGNAQEQEAELKTKLAIQERIQALKDLEKARKKAEAADPVKTRLDADAKARQSRLEQLTLTERQTQEENRTSKARQQARIAQIAVDGMSIEGAKKLGSLREVEDQLAASAHRRRHAQTDQEIRDEYELRQALLARKKVLDDINRAAQPRQPVPEATLAQRRQAMTERMFGDGGAHLLTVQAGLMAGYSVINGLKSMITGSIDTVIQLDTALRQLQAISATTNGQMVQLKESVIGVSESTKFSAVEVANAAIQLAQAGFTTKQIEQSLRGIALFAHATGTEIAKAVDLTTTVMTTFDRDASQAEEIANKMTLALNRSKLDVQKLTLGLQYAGNAAADSGVSFEELTGVLGAMANAGIRSGSTLGTGTRQIMVELQKPNEKLQAILERLGLNLEDVNLHAHGLVGVMNNLKQAGFTTADAFQAFQVRGAAAFSAFTNNEQTFYKIEQGMYGVGAAAQASDVQMQSLAIQMDRLKTNAGVLAEEAFSPLRAGLRDVIKGMADLLKVTGPAGAGLRTFGTILGSLAIGAAVSGLVSLGVGLWKMIEVASLATSGVLALRDAVVALKTAETIATVASAGFLASLKKLLVPLRWVMMSPWGRALAIAATVAAVAFKAFSKESADLHDNLDDLKTKLQESQGVLDAQAANLTALSEALTNIEAKQSSLVANSDELRTVNAQLSEQFGKMGLSLKQGLLTPIEDTIKAMKEMRNQGNLLQAAGLMAQLPAMRAAQAAEEQVLFDKYAKSRGEANGRLGGFTAPAGVTPLEAQAFDYLRTNPLSNSPTPVYGKQADDYARSVRILDGFFNRMIVAGKSEGLGELQKTLEIMQTVVSSAGQYHAKVTQDREDIRNQRITASGLTRSSEFYATPAGVDVQWRQAQIARLMSPTLAQENKGIYKDDPVAYAKFFHQTFAEYQKPLETARKGLEDRNTSLVESMKGVSRSSSEYEKLRSEVDSNMAILEGINRSLSDISEKAVRLDEEANKDLRLMAESRQTTAKDRLEALKKQVASENNPERILATLQGDMLKEIDAIAKEQETLSDKAKKGSKTAKAARKTELAKQRQTMIDEVKDLVKGRVGEIQQNERDFAQKQGKLDYSKTFQPIKEAFKALDTSVNMALEGRGTALGSNVLKLQSQIREAQLASVGFRSTTPGAIGATDSAELGLRQQVSNRFHLTALRKQLVEAKQAEAGGRIQAIDATIPQMQSQLDLQRTAVETLRKDRDEARAKYDALTEQRKNAPKGASYSESEKKAYQESLDNYQKLTDLYNTQQAEAVNMENSIYGLDQKRNELADLLNSKEGKFQTWFDAMQTGIEGLTQGFSDMFQRIVSGTGDTKEAFREMARGILASMLKVVSDKIAQKFMEMILGSAGNMFSPTGTASSSEVAGMTATATFSSNRAGGMIRRSAGGYVPGRVARDAVPTMLMPGEFVLQKTATSALGEGYLTGLNRTTEATLRQGAEQAKGVGYPAEKSPPGLVNVWVVTPDQQTPMTKDDIIVTVSDNIARGGSIRKQIKQVQVGG